MGVKRAMVMICLASASWEATAQSSAAPPGDAPVTVRLQEPQRDGQLSVERALAERRSSRHFTEEPVELAELSQLLWAAQGMTDDMGHRTAPSAGGLYPLEIIVAVGEVTGLAPGAYRYQPSAHELRAVGPGDRRPALRRAALDQEWVEQGAVVIVLAAVYQRTMRKYGDRGRRYVHIEVGHAAQNVYLQAASLGLGTVLVGAFDDDEVRTALDLGVEEHPLALMPVGRKPSRAMQ